MKLILCFFVLCFRTAEGWRHLIPAVPAAHVYCDNPPRLCGMVEAACGMVEAACGMAVEACEMVVEACGMAVEACEIVVMSCEIVLDYFFLLADPAKIVLDFC